MANGIPYNFCQLHRRHWTIRANDAVVSDVNAEAVIGKVECDLCGIFLMFCIFGRYNVHLLTCILWTYNMHGWFCCEVFLLNVYHFQTTNLAM